MEDSAIWSRRPRNINPTSGKLKSSLHYTWTGPIDPQLYSDSLIYLSKCTEQNLAILERFSKQQHTIQPNDFQRHSSYGQSSLMDFGLDFAPRDTFSSLARSSVLDDDSSSAVSISAPVSHCYLCSTLDQHRRHLLTLSAEKSKKLPRPRTCYIAPRPRVRPKKIEEPQAVYDSSYRVAVWTGNKPDATTDTSIYITIKGDQNILHKTRLCHGSSKNKKFCFIQGARDVFYVRSPALGNLEILTIELECWLFECKNWLSLHHGDYKIARDLMAVNLNRKMQEFQLTVTTGSKNLAGTDADVYVTFYGTRGRSDKIKLVAEDSRSVFQRNSVDIFHVNVLDIGEIRTLRIEHNGKGLASGWFLENVVMKDVKHPKTVYYFLLHGWLAKDIGDGRLWREISAKKTLPREIISAKPRMLRVAGNLIKYGVTVRTGDVRYAGTDANVYIVIQGTNGKTKKLFMDDGNNNFEKGMTEEFELEAFNTGPVTNIHIGHDNTGPGSGWYCEDVTVKRYLCKEEQMKFLNRLKNKLQDQRRNSSTKLEKSYLADLKKDKSAKNDDNSEEELEQESYRDVFDADGKVIKVPFYEQYFFECKAWLAKDEGDGLVVRELEVKKKSIIFKDR